MVSTLNFRGGELLMFSWQFSAMESNPELHLKSNHLGNLVCEVTPTNKQTNKQTKEQTKQRNEQTQEETSNQQEETNNQQEETTTNNMDCFRRLPFVSVMFLMPMFFPLAFFPYLTSAGSLSMAHPNPWKPGRVRDTRLQIWFIRVGWFAWRGRKLSVGWSAGFTMTWRNATPLKLVSEISIHQRHEKQVQWVTRIFWLVIGKVFEMYTM